MSLRLEGTHTELRSLRIYPTYAKLRKNLENQTADSVLEMKRFRLLTKRLTDRLTVKRNVSHCFLITWLRTRKKFANLCRTNLCIGGLKTKFPSLGFKNEASSFHFLSNKLSYCHLKIPKSMNSVLKSRHQRFPIISLANTEQKYQRKAPYNFEALVFPL